MNIPSELRDKLIYSDPNFIALAFEQATKESPKTQISTSSSFAPRLSAGVFSVAATVQESKTFSISTFQMLAIVRDIIEGYPEFDSASFDTSTATETSWIAGTLTIGEWTSKTNGTTTGKTQVFQIITSEGPSHTLVVQTELFSAGIGLLTQMDSIVTHGMDIPVIVLGRVLFRNPLANDYTTSPYLIIESE